MNFVRYEPGVERLQPGEAESIAELTRIFAQVQARVVAKHGAARDAR